MVRVYAFKDYGAVKAFDLLNVLKRPNRDAQKLAFVLPELFRCYDLIDGDNIVRYIILAYDRQSPFRASSQLALDRKRNILDHIGIKKGDRLYDKLITLAGDVDDEEIMTIVDGISCYLKFQSDKLWSLISMNEIVFDQYICDANKPITTFKGDKERLQAIEVKAKLMRDAEECHNRLKRYWAEFTGKDVDAEVALQRAKPMTPETISDFLKDDYGDEEE